jgi:hypothetical protein
MARRAVALPALDGLFLAAFLDPWGCPAGNLFCFNSHPAPVNAVMLAAVQVAMIGCGEIRSLTAEGPM